jgi:hypothetical protein
MQKRTLVAALALAAAPSFVWAAGGFDALGYNESARIFNGKADGVDGVLDGLLYFDADYDAYVNDRLVMKWSQAWEDAATDGWSPAAWIDNQWNGAVPGGSGEVWHYKIVWVGPQLEASPYWRTGGYAIWDEFEVISDHGMTADQERIVYAHAGPNGHGARK